uniref:Nodule-specific Glycine Rich Peptide n=2 Tax=Medicago truncatula TaxID=3880 RepID=I3SEU6_MEDTR|nr:unknown [Medicago truncatula]
MHYSSLLRQLCLPKGNNVYIYKIVYIYAQLYCVYSFIFNKKSFIFAACETEKPKINIVVHGYANWLGRGTVLQGGDRNTNECVGGNVINFLDSQKEEDNGNIVHFPVMGNAVNSPAVGHKGGGGNVVHFPGGGKGGGRGNLGGSSGNAGGNE